MASCGVDVEETLFIMCPYPTKSYSALPCDGLEVSIKERSSRESRTSGSWLLLSSPWFYLNISTFQILEMRSA